MKLEFINNWSERKFLLITLSSIFVVFSLLGLQGFDMCDEGWVLTGYQQIFNDPVSVEYLMMYYLAQIIGGCWNLIFGVFGIYSFRILSAIVLTSVVLIVYLFLRRVNRSVFLIGVLVTILTQSFGIIVFHHNYLTTLLSCLVAIFLMKGLLGNSSLFVGLAGLGVGLAVFARLPNLSMMSLMIVIAVYAYYENIKRAFLFMIVFVFGFCCGIAIVIFLMILLGHTDIFQNAIISGFSAAESSGSTHNLKYMMGVYISNYINVIKCALAIFIPLFLIHKIDSINRIKFSAIPWFLVLMAILVYISILLYKYTAIFVVYGLCTPLLFYELYSGRKNKNRSIPTLIVLVLLYCIPLGSDFGIGNMGSWSVWLAIPYCCHILYSMLRQFHSKYFSIFWMAFLISFVISGVYEISSCCYFDKGWRWNKTSSIDSPLATTFTTKKSALQVNEILLELKQYVKKDDCLFCFQHFASLYYLTETKPYLYNPWPWTYDPDNLEKQIRRAEREHNYLPVLVRDKSCTGKWPEPDDGWDNTDMKDSYMHKNKRIVSIQNFIKRNKYSVVWENSLFQIMLPSENK